MKYKHIFLIAFVLLLLISPVLATTTDVYAAGATASGRASRAATSETFPVISSSPGTASDNTTANITIVGIAATTTSQQYNANVRYIFSGHLNNSGVPTNGIVDSAYFAMKGASTKSLQLGKINIMMVGGTPTDPLHVHPSDYNVNGTVLFSNTIIPYASWNEYGYNVFPLNDAALNSLSLSGYSTIMLQAEWDKKSFGPDWMSGGNSVMKGINTPASGTADDPKLVVTWHLPGETVTPTSMILSNASYAYGAHVGTPAYANINVPVGFNDTSRGQPTSWSWNFGDGSTSTEQNITHTFTTSGVYNVSLNATNSAGSHVSYYPISIINPSGYSDTFDSDTSSLYSGEVSSFVWDLTNQVLRANYSTTHRMVWYNNSQFYGGIYNVTFKLKDYGDNGGLLGEFIFGGQEQALGSWFTNGTHYTIYIKNTTNQGDAGTWIILGRAIAGSHDQITTHSLASYELNHEYALVINWSPYSSGERINVTLDGTPVISSTDWRITGPGWSGFARHGYGGTIWWDNMYLMQGPQPPVVVSSFTKSSLIGRVGRVISFTDNSTNTPDHWYWYYGDDETVSNTSRNVSVVFDTIGIKQVRLYANSSAGGSWHNESVDIRQGSTATTQNVTHQYTRPGLRTVTLTICNIAGCNSTSQRVWVYLSRPQEFTPGVDQPLYYSCDDLTYSSSRVLSQVEATKVLENLIKTCIGGEL